MRSDKWDEDERKPFDGMMSKKEGHEHNFSLSGGRCVVCNLTREEVRKSW